jgi:hypothetical protein
LEFDAGPIAGVFAGDMDDEAEQSAVFDFDLEDVSSGEFEGNGEAHAGFGDIGHLPIAGALRIGEVGDIGAYRGYAFSDYMTLVETPVHGDLSSDFPGALGKPGNTGTGGGPGNRFDPRGRGAEGSWRRSIGTDFLHFKEQISGHISTEAAGGLAKGE